MNEYWYIRPTHFLDGVLYTYGQQAGSVTQDPVDAYRQFMLSMGAGLRAHRWKPLNSGDTFAAWRLSGKVSLEGATSQARERRPDRVYVLREGRDWPSLILALPDETPFKFLQVATPGEEGEGQ
jgi:hypothetical protein